MHFEYGTEIGSRKDSPAFWRHVLESLRVDRAHVVVVGDTLEQDVIGPREQGIFSVWFDERGGHGGEARDYPIVHRLQDVVPIVRALQAKEGTRDTRA